MLAQLFSDWSDTLWASLWWLSRGDDDMAEVEDFTRVALILVLIK